MLPLEFLKLNDAICVHGPKSVSKYEKKITMRFECTEKASNSMQVQTGAWCDLNKSLHKYRLAYF